MPQQMPQPTPEQMPGQMPMPQPLPQPRLQPGAAVDPAIFTHVLLLDFKDVFGEAQEVSAAVYFADLIVYNDDLQAFGATVYTDVLDPTLFPWALDEEAPMTKVSCVMEDEDIRWRWLSRIVTRPRLEKLRDRLRQSSAARVAEDVPMPVPSPARHTPCGLPVAAATPLPTPQPQVAWALLLLSLAHC